MRGDYIKKQPKKTSQPKQELQTFQLEEMSWKKIDSLPREKTLVVLPIRPMEEHGPHLPVGTDFLTARDAAKDAIKILQKKQTDWHYILLPGIPLGFSKIATDFPGTITVSPKTIKQIILGICSSLAESGFKYILICTYHMDLGHLKGIYAGMKKIRSRYPVKIYEPSGPYFFNKEVEKREPKLGFDTTREVHAGFRETSLMKYQYPYLVDKSYQKLQSIYMDLYSPRVIGKTFKDLGLDDGYVGSPARADSDYGRWLFQDTVNLYVESALALPTDKELPQLPEKTKRLMKSLFWL